MSVSLAQADKLPAIQDTTLIEILPNFTVIAETKAKDSIIYVRIIKVQHFGECGNRPETCPKSTVYISTSSYDEYPEQKVFKLPKMHGWRFGGWVSFPKGEGLEDYVVFKMEAEIPSKDISKSWWDKKTYMLKVNYHQAEMWPE